MSAKGGQTWELDFGSFNIPPHFHTYVRAPCKFWRYSNAPKRSFPRNPDLWAHAVYPFDFLRTTIDQWTFHLVCVWLGHRSMENKFGHKLSQDSIR